VPPGIMNNISIESAKCWTIFF